MHHRFLETGTLIPGGPIDAAFVHYVLEHGYAWLHSGASQRFWDAPFFYPAPNSMAYSEVLLGLLPFYIIWRIAGIDAGTAYQLWFVSLSMLNFVLMYLFLRRVAEVRRLPATVGAYFFCFASARLNQLSVSHPQFWAEFYVVLAVWFLVRFLESRTDTPRYKAVSWLSLAAAAVALQLISGFYFGWFLCFSLLVAFLLGLAQRRPRQALSGLLRQFWPALLAAAAVLMLLAGPSLMHYRAAARDILPVAAHPIMPTLGSWVYAGDFNLLYSWLRYFPKISRVNSFFERANGVGLCTGILILAGAFASRCHRVFRPVLLACVAVLILSFTAPGEWSLWWYVSRFIPGAPAIRVVSRLGVFLLFPFAMALALCLDRIQTRHGAVLVVLLGAAVAAEQVNRVPYYDFQRIAHEAAYYANQLKPGCNSFFVSHLSHDGEDWAELQVKAMWAQVISGVPTVNGYSGYWPVRYPLGAAGVATSLDFTRTVGLAAWQAANPRTPLRVCWLHPDAPPPLEIVSPVVDSPLHRFIRWSYIGILGRLPRADEAAAAERAASAQDHGRARLVLSLLASPEAQARVFLEKANLAMLGSDIDPDRWRLLLRISADSPKPDLLAVAGLISSVDHARHSTDPAEVVRRIEGDRKLDHRAFAGLMYLCLLGRSPGPGGAENGAKCLDSGLSKTRYVDDFLGGPEYQKLIGQEP